MQAPPQSTAIAAFQQQTPTRVRRSLGPLSKTRLAVSGWLTLHAGLQQMFLKPGGSR